MAAIKIGDNEPSLLHLCSALFQDSDAAERARSTGSGVYGVPPNGRKVPDGWQKTGA